MSWSKGKVARQAHVGIPAGLVEEEIARSGFFGKTTHFYRKDAPVGWSRIEGDLRPHALHLGELAPPGGDFVSARAPFLENEDVRLSFARFADPASFAWRNADGDELLFVHGGAGLLESDFGALAYRTGDYLLIPRGCAYRLLPADATSLFVVESRGEIGLPDRGLLGHHALFDPAVIDTPEPAVSRLPPREEHELRILRGGQVTKVFYPFDPLAAEGWKGDLAIQRLAISDIRPIMSERYHLPPSAHATFVADGWVCCTFLPRGLETGDPEAMKVPFYHSNIDFDEVLFYHRGEFFSRKGIAPGMVTFHPQGIHHGPQPGAVAAAKDKTRTDEVAVMIDTRRPLSLTASGLRVSDPDYVHSWKGAAR